MTHVDESGPATTGISLSAKDAAQLRALGKAALPKPRAKKVRPMYEWERYDYRAQQRRQKEEADAKAAAATAQTRPPRYAQWTRKDTARLADALKTIAALYGAPVSPNAAASAGLVLLERALGAAKGSRVCAEELLRTIAAAANGRGDK